MGKKLPTTPRSRVTAALRQVWLRSRERAAAIKNAGNCCEECGVKASKAKGKEQKIEVHHVEGHIPWTPLIDYIFKHLLVDPKKLEVLCPKCHEDRHYTEENHG